jgi:hypothetical protein
MEGRSLTESNHPTWQNAPTGILAALAKNLDKFMVVEYRAPVLIVLTPGLTPNCT